MIENHSTTRQELYSHLMRRVGVGCTLNELEKISKISYESLVDQILSPENPDSFQEDDFDRYCRRTSERTVTRLEAANTLTVSAFESKLVVHRPEVIVIKTSFFA